MTRFARAGQINQKKPHEASSWSELTESQRKSKNKKHKEGQERNNERKSLLVKKKAKIHKHDKPKGLHEKATELAVNLPEVEKKELLEFVKKDEKRENRRLKRIQEKQVEKVCYHCRKSGHAMGDCPERRQDLDQGTGICFKCGSTEHNSASCRVRLPTGEFPYAKCFICGETGHLSKQCPDNPRGLYPKGGCCNECGSVEHYQRDCPEKQKKQGIDDWRLPKLNAFGSADDDPSLHQPPPSTSKQRQGPKMVKF